VKLSLVAVAVACFSAVRSRILFFRLPAEAEVSRYSFCLPAEADVSRRSFVTGTEASFATFLTLVANPVVRSMLFLSFAAGAEASHSFPFVCLFA